MFSLCGTMCLCYAALDSTSNPWGTDRLALFHCVGAAEFRPNAPFNRRVIASDHEWAWDIFSLSVLRPSTHTHSWVYISCCNLTLKTYIWTLKCVLIFLVSLIDTIPSFMPIAFFCHYTLHSEIYLFGVHQKALSRYFRLCLCENLQENASAWL